MQKPELTPEIEDVLSSIRRLVSGQPQERRVAAVTQPPKAPDAAPEAIVDADLPEISDVDAADPEPVSAAQEQPQDKVGGGSVSPAANDPEVAVDAILDALAPGTDALVLGPALRLPDAANDALSDVTDNQTSDEVGPKKRKTADAALWQRVGETLSETEAGFESDMPAPVVSWANKALEDDELKAEIGIPAFVRALQSGGFSTTPRQQSQARPVREDPEAVLQRELAEDTDKAPASKFDDDLSWPPQMDDAEMAQALGLVTGQTVVDDATTAPIEEESPAEAVALDPLSDPAENSPESDDFAADFAMQALSADLAEHVTHRVELQAPDLAEAVVAQRAQAVQDFDRDALYDIVADIVREELQGALGERITRNVRKLVRTEINRALTSREFE